MPCHGIDGLYSGHEVNIGYRPYRTTRPTAIRVACGTRAMGPARLRARVVAATDVYIRYSPAGTAWDYRLRGDRVELRCHGPRGFDGVTVVSSRHLPAAATGWATAGALTRG